MKIVGKVFGVAMVAGFIAFWSVITLAFDMMLIRGVVQEAAARNWPTVAGRITSSQVKVEHDSEGGNSYNPIVRYSYRVDGRPYEGERVKFGFKSSTRAAAQHMIKKYYVGGDVNVHHDPHKPAEAVLETDVLTGTDLFGTIFMTPFNAVMLAGWVIGWKSLFASSESARRMGGFRMFEEPRTVRLRLAPISPLAAAVCTAAGAAFVLIFLIALTFGFESRYGAAAGWAIIIGLSTIVYRRMRQRASDGWYDVVIDEARLTLTLPPSLKRAEVGELKFDELAAVDVVKTAGRGDNSDSYRPTLRWNRGGEQSVVLAKMSSRDAVETMAKWLRQRLYLDVPPQGQGATASLSTAG
jgi:hypothetical protein